jgi:hypothetical protein
MNPSGETPFPCAIEFRTKRALKKKQSLAGRMCRIPDRSEEIA